MDPDPSHADCAAAEHERTEQKIAKDGARRSSEEKRKWRQRSGRGRGANLDSMSRQKSMAPELLGEV